MIEWICLDPLHFLICPGIQFFLLIFGMWHFLMAQIKSYKSVFFFLNNKTGTTIFTMAYDQ
jgi:hypothetical protein